MLDEKMSALMRRRSSVNSCDDEDEDEDEEEDEDPDEATGSLRWFSRASFLASRTRAIIWSPWCLSTMSW